MNDFEIILLYNTKMDCVKTKNIRLDNTSLEKNKSINDKTKYSINDNVGLTDITGLEYKLFLKLWKT
tara:strand:- start:1084 stop:1284 length:201 start_codon:yes stop_codon:yes gene_type:complete